MIYIDAGIRDEQSFDARLVFASTLRRAGLRVGLDDKTVPQKIYRTQKFDAVDLLVSPDTTPPAGLMILGAERMSDPTLSTLRTYRSDRAFPVVALGRFATRQDRLGAQAKIAFASGSEPTLIDLADLQPAALIQGSRQPLFAATDALRAPRNTPRVLVYLPADIVDTPDLAAGLSLFGALRTVSVSFVCPAKAKARLSAVPGAPPVYAYGELSPHALADRTDIAVVLGTTSPGARIAQLCAEVIGAGGLVVDGTGAGVLLQSHAPVVPGPAALAQVPAFLEHNILPNIDALRGEVAASDWRKGNAAARLIARIPEEVQPAPEITSAPSAPKTVFLPTNGVGLGHAQRCSLIADEMPAGDPVSFAGFPSCVELVEDRGYGCHPLIQKSEAHSESFGNDMVNYRRLKRWLEPGDRLVFDGVYVFDSVYRTILEHDLDAVWVRRGLWRAHQTNEASLAREHAFSRVVVPREAFDELNQHYSFGGRIHHVGPIVRPPVATSVAAARNAIARQVGRRFSRLVVSMLGGGVAADRGPQLQTVAAALEGQPDILHLVVVWPNAKVAPSLMLWQNTRVVRALDAVWLARAADFLVTAVGYNSFHEVLYHQIPAIMIPQTAPYMDDQERRAASAVDRGLADMVLPDDLIELDRTVRAFLDGGRAEALRGALRGAALPEPGNAAAAAIISQGDTDVRRLA